MKAESVLGLIGNTPHLKINRLFRSDISVWLKLERNNPGGSIKDRIALAMIEQAESKGMLKSGSVIIEPTSGNTGIGLAMVAALKGYRIILVMPESMSVERRKIMAAYGAEFDLTPREKGMAGAIERARQLHDEISGSWIPMQFENQANPETHMKTTAAEILDDFPDGIDFLVAGVGTGGHITGCARILRQRFPSLRVMAVEPEASPVLSGGKPGPHPIQGLGAGFVPPVLDMGVIDEIITVGREEAYSFTRRAAREEGLLAGISTGAVLAAVNRKMDTFSPGSRILTFNYDTGERYLSDEGLF
ncbi:MAG TPA: cysteine synthase A [Bacteroidales bacterium]|jgi:cysteine synthase A|nr:cysteine synthase A [Bacteroidales bacterium]